MSDAVRKRLTVAAVVLKCLAIAAILRPLLVRHASKVVTVFAHAFPGAAASAGHARSYTYFSGFHVLSFRDIKWALTLGVVLYAGGLVLQFLAAARPQTPGPAPDRLSS
jgi:hypothetical protein